MQKKIAETNDDLLKAYFRQIKIFPLLTFEEELELSKQIQKGDVEALHKLINSNLRLVVRIAGLFSKYGIPILDIIQEGNMGLMHAARKYDHRKNVRFCTYANWWIKQHISRYISNKSRMVRLPMRKEETLRKIRNAYTSLSQTLMQRPKNSDIARELGIPVKDIENIINTVSVYSQIEQNNIEDNVDFMAVHEDYTYSPERVLFKQFSNDTTKRVLSKLKEREKSVLNYRYQLNGCERHTLREIGDKFNISPETVRQIEMRALKKIRTHANELRDGMYVG